MEQESDSTIIQACQNLLEYASKITESWDTEQRQYDSTKADLSRLLLHAAHANAILRQSQMEFKAETSSTAEKAEALAGEPSCFMQRWKSAAQSNYPGLVPSPEIPEGNSNLVDFGV